MDGRIAIVDAREKPGGMWNDTYNVRLHQPHPFSPQADLTADYVRAPHELVVIDGASHWLPEERPEEVADAITARVDPR